MAFTDKTLLSVFLIVVIVYSLGLAMFSVVTGQWLWVVVGFCSTASASSTLANMY